MITSPDTPFSDCAHASGGRLSYRRGRTAARSGGPARAQRVRGEARVSPTARTRARRGASGCGLRADACERTRTRPMSEPLVKDRPPATAETPAQMRALEELVVAREHQDGKMLAVNDARLLSSKRNSQLATPGSDEALVAKAELQSVVEDCNRAVAECAKTLALRRQLDEAQTIRWVLANAAHGRARALGSEGSKRRLMLIGRQYYWQTPKAVPFGALPPYVTQVLAHYGLQDFNGILVNVYEHRESKIGAHCDATQDLASGPVKTLSLAIRPEDRRPIFAGGQPPTLSRLEFRGPDNNGPHGSAYMELYHGKVCEFDAFAHAAVRRTHEVRETLRPRVSFTCRQFKPSVEELTVEAEVAGEKRKREGE